jgi:hypothetical protein
VCKCIWVVHHSVGKVKAGAAKVYSKDPVELVYKCKLVGEKVTEETSVLVEAEEEMGMDKALQAEHEQLL